MLLLVWIIVFVTLLFVFSLDSILKQNKVKKQKKSNPRIVKREINGEMVNVLLT